MIRNQKLAEYLEPFTKTELVYKRYYEIQKEHNPLDDLLRDLNAEGFPVEQLYLPVVNPQHQDRGIDCLFYPYDEEISIARHIRYHPPFLHSHQFYELIYQIKGVCKNTVNHQVIDMQEGDICIIPPGPLHSIEVLDDSIIINILIKTHSLDEHLSALLIPQNIITNFFQHSCEFRYSYNSLLFHTTGDQAVQRLMEDMILECFETDANSLPLRKTLLLSVFSHLLRSHTADMEVSSNNVCMNPEIYQIYQYLQLHYKNATLKETAKHFNYSAVYFSKLIHRNIGKTFNEILMKMKLSAACRLLTTTQLPIGEIAAEVGYESPEYFNIVFKKNFNTTPSSYRKGNGAVTNISLIGANPFYRKPFSLQS